MHLLPRLWVFALWVFPIGACAEVTTPPDTAPMTTIFKVGRGGGEQEGEPLEGVRVCEAGTDNCDLSNANGEVTIELRVGPDISYTADKKGYASRLFADVMPPEGRSLGRKLGTDAFIAGLHDRVHSPYPMSLTGTIAIDTDPNRLAGVTFELVGATNNAFYDDEEGLWSVDPTATTSWGGGGFTEVTPGVYQIRLGGTARDCVPNLAWPGGENTIRLPVREGYITTAVVTCPIRP